MNDRTSRYLARKTRGRTTDQEVDSPSPASTSTIEPIKVVIHNQTKSVKMPPSFRIK
jgi:Retrotransposon gag protein